MTERCKHNPCCGDYLGCKPPPQFKPRESWEDYKARTAPLSSPASSSTAGAIPRAPNTGRYLAETNDGRLLYPNHASEWQEMPNILARPSVVDLPYQVLFDAIAAATSPYGDTGVNISVEKFRSALSSPAEAEALQAGVDVHEVGRDDLKRRAVKLLARNGWKPGDQFSAHSTAELMVALAIDAVKNPPDRCAWPECGCCHDASCNEAALSSAPAQEDGAKELGAHPRGSGQSMEGSQS